MAPLLGAGEGRRTRRIPISSSASLGTESAVWFVTLGFTISLCASIEGSGRGLTEGHPAASDHSMPGRRVLPERRDS